MKGVGGFSSEVTLQPFGKWAPKIWTLYMASVCDGRLRMPLFSYALVCGLKFGQVRYVQRWSEMVWQKQ